MDEIKKSWKEYWHIICLSLIFAVALFFLEGTPFFKGIFQFGAVLTALIFIFGGQINRLTVPAEKVIMLIVSSVLIIAGSLAYLFLAPDTAYFWGALLPLFFYSAMILMVVAGNSLNRS